MSESSRAPDQFSCRAWVRIKLETYNFILYISSLFRSSQLDETRANEIKHDIDPEKYVHSEKEYFIKVA